MNDCMSAESGEEGGDSLIGDDTPESELLSSPFCEVLVSHIFTGSHLYL